MERTHLHAWPTTVFILLGLFLSAHGHVSGQIGRTLGGYFGGVSSKQAWDEQVSSDWRTGFTAGLFLDAPTPIPLLSGRVEVTYAGRGGVIWDSVEDSAREMEAHVRSHYMGIQAHGKIGTTFGSLNAYIFGGPIAEAIVKTSCTEPFCEILGKSTKLVVGAVGGGGVGWNFQDRFRAELEFKYTEGMRDAYENAFSGVADRSRSLILRIGIPFNVDVNMTVAR